MKKLSALLGTFIILISLSACGSRRFSPEDMLESEFDSAELSSAVELKVRGEVDSGSTRIPIRFKNCSGYDCSYDSMRRLEVKLGGRWYIVPDSEPAVPLSLYSLPAGESGDSELSLSGHYGFLPRGLYRVIKQFVSDDGSLFSSAAEFTVK